MKQSVDEEQLKQLINAIVLHIPGWEVSRPYERCPNYYRIYDTKSPDRSIIFQVSDKASKQGKIFVHVNLVAQNEKIGNIGEGPHGMTLSFNRGAETLAKAIKKKLIPEVDRQLVLHKIEIEETKMREAVAFEADRVLTKYLGRSVANKHIGAINGTHLRVYPKVIPGKVRLELDVCSKKIESFLKFIQGGL